jgi:hypothetical protein
MSHVFGALEPPGRHVRVVDLHQCPVVPCRRRCHVRNLALIFVIAWSIVRGAIKGIFWAAILGLPVVLVFNWERHTLVVILGIIAFRALSNAVRDAHGFMVDQQVSDHALVDAWRNLLN